MECPKCNDNLISFSVDHLEFDECKNCEGIWFSKDELRQVKNLADSDLNWMDFVIWKHTDRFKAKPHKYTCPNCCAKMDVLDYDNTNVEIDYCSECQGIWLDKDKLVKIIDSLEEELISKSFSEYVKSTINEAKDLITGPNSFLSEWKDFSTLLRFLQYRILSLNPKITEAFVEFQTNPLNK